MRHKRGGARQALPDNPLDLPADAAYRRRSLPISLGAARTYARTRTHAHTPVVEHKAALQERLVKKGAYKKRKAGSDQPGGSAAAAAAVAAGAGDGGDADEEEDAGAGGAGANDGGEQQGDVPMAEAGTV